MERRKENWIPLLDDRTGVPLYPELMAGHHQEDTHRWPDASPQLGQT
jgi:hypothetical protein